MATKEYGIIYKVTNKLNGKVYIGQTTQLLSWRWSDHCCRVNSSCKALHYSIQKYGRDNFTCEPLLSCFNRPDLNNFETYYIKYFNSFSKLGYNLSYGGYYSPTYKNRISVIGFNFKTGEEFFLDRLHADSRKRGFDGRSVVRCLRGDYTSHKNCVFIKASEYSVEKINELIDKEIEKQLNFKRKNGTCKYRGVSITQKNKYTTSIKIKGKSIALGQFNTEIEAFNVYKKRFLEEYHRKSA